MKTIDPRIGEPENSIPARQEVVMDDDTVLDDKAALPKNTLAPLIVSSLASRNTSIVSKKTQALSRRDSNSIARLQAEFLHVSLPLVFADQNPVRTLGVTSAVIGEGKTLAAVLVGHALATSSRRPVVLVECDWERPTFSRDLELPASPGLSEWLRGAAERSEIRHHLMPNLTVIPAGLGGADAITVLGEIKRPDFRERFADPDELLILDLPSVLGSYYGPLAARLADALLLVVRAGSTPTSFVTQACDALKSMRVEGIILNQVQTRIPRWLQNLL